MLEQIWHYFETTGDVTAYLHFKDYERTKQSLLDGQVDRIDEL